MPKDKTTPESTEQDTETTGTEATFNADEFRKSILDEVNKSINSINKNLSKELKKLAGGTTQSTATTKSEPEAEETETDDKTITPETRAAFKTIKSMTAKLEEKERAIAASEAARLETERKAAVREAMGGVNWASKSSQDLFFKAVIGDVVRNEDGDIVGKGSDGELPLKDFVQEMVDANPNFLAPKGLGGSGATGTHGSKGSKGIDLDDIKPGMSREQLTEILKQAAMLTPTQQ